MPKNFSKILIIALFVIFFGCFFFFGWYKFLNLETLKANQNMLQNFVTSNYLLTVIAFVGIYILAIALQIPSASVFTLAGGLLFGLVGIIWVNIGATLGSIISFLTSRYLFQELLNKKFTKELNSINNELNKNSTSYLFFVRLTPVLPFFLVNILLGLTNVKLIKFVWTTILGIIPGSFVYVYAGTQLGTINSLNDIASPRIFLIFIFFGLLSLVPIIFKKLKSS